MNNTNQKYDIAIIGSGLVGAIQSLLLAQKGFKILLLDKSDNIKHKYLDSNGKLIQDNLLDNIDLRVSAITLKSEEILDSLNLDLNILDVLNLRSGLMSQIYAWDDNGPNNIEFNSNLIAKDYLARVVENSLLLEILIYNIKLNNNIYLINNFDIKNIVSLNNKSIISGSLISEKLESSLEYNTDLIIGADGANSWVRNYFDFDLDISSYNNHALVTNVITEKPHNNIAYQKFFSTGPIAFLPIFNNLSNNSGDDYSISSIVWSTSEFEAKKLLKLSEQEFNNLIAELFDYKLGKITSSGKKAVFPLFKRHVKNYYKNNIILIGDAAHTVHPLAGQGLNMGIYDAACLAEVLFNAKNNNLNINNSRVLKQYELKRYGHNQQLLYLMDFFKNSFSSEKISVQLIRNLGMGLINNFDFAKKQICLHAAGY